MIKKKNLKPREMESKRRKKMEKSGESRAKFKADKTEQKSRK